MLFETYPVLTNLKPKSLDYNVIGKYKNGLILINNSVAIDMYS